MPGCRILFVCVENAGRSQMAEAFFRLHAPERFQSASAGTEPALRVNPLVVRAMREVGIDIGGKTPRRLSGGMIDGSTRAVSMGCMDRASCPVLLAGGVLEWDVPDPKGRPMGEVRKIRDQIEAKVVDLIKTLEAE